MRLCGLAGLALALLLGGGVRADDKRGEKAEGVKKEWKRLNGTWVLGKVDADPETRTLAGGETLTIKEGKYTVRDAGKLVEQGTAKIDPTTSPKSLDATTSSGPKKGEVSRVIYELKGDTHRLCFAPPGKPRPKVFESKKGSGDALHTFKRAKARD